MRHHELINPEDFFTTMRRDGTFDGNNALAIYAPNHNPEGHSPGKPHDAGAHNPNGNVPILNPEHYIHPLTMRYTRGPLDFA